MPVVCHVRLCIRLCVPQARPPSECECDFSGRGWDMQSVLCSTSSTAIRMSVLTFVSRLGSVFGFVLHRHDRDPNAPTGICRCMVCLQILIKMFSKIDKKIIENASKMLPEWPQVGSRWPFESSLGSGTLPRRVPTVRPSHFWTPNWSQNRPGSLQKSIWKATSQQTRFRERFGTDFQVIFEPLKANF